MNLELLRLLGSGGTTLENRLRGRKILELLEFLFAAVLGITVLDEGKDSS